jgi:type I restriction enzyme S subunit
LVPPGADFVYSPQVCFWRSADTHRLSPFVLHAWMRSSRFVQQINAVKGQTDMADYVSLRDQRNMVIHLPDQDTSREIDRLAGPLAQSAVAHHAEVRMLRAIRDELLPKVVRGKIRVPLAEDIAEAGDEAALKEAAA